MEEYIFRLIQSIETQQQKLNSVESELNKYLQFNKTNNLETNDEETPKQQIKQHETVLDKYDEIITQLDTISIAVDELKISTNEMKIKMNSTECLITHNEEKYMLLMYENISLNEQKEIQKLEVEEKMKLMKNKRGLKRIKWDLELRTPLSGHPKRN